MGDWWMSNQTMNRALEFAGYDVRHIWGAGTHNGSQAACRVSRRDALALEGLAGGYPGWYAWQSGNQSDSAAGRRLAGLRLKAARSLLGCQILTGQIQCGSASSARRLRLEPTAGFIKLARGVG